MVRTLVLRVVSLSFVGLLANNFVVAEDRPNVVLIMADDVSWECFGCYGAQDYETPRLDELAKKGVRFSHCYSTPICTTSRVKLMTGQYNFRNYTHFGYLDPKQKTFGQLMQSAGYKTAIAGKWQLNGLYNSLPGSLDETRPNKAGFDEYMLWQLTKGKGGKGGGERFWSPVLEHNGKYMGIEENQDLYGPDLLCDFICDFMERNQEEPFFVYYPMVLVHDPFVPTPDTIGDRSRGHETNKAVKSEKKENFVAMVNYMDKIIGRIVDKLDAIGELENTIVMFTADNGTNPSITSEWNNRTIKGGKGGMTDMGTHVPFIAYWKGKTPESKVYDTLVDFTDFYPTLADAAGMKLGEDDPTDGLSFYPRLVGEEGPARDWVLTHYQPYWNKKPGQFARNQQFKLYRDGRFFDIGSGDLEEKIDLGKDGANSISAANATSKTSMRELQAVLDSAPPAPTGKGDRNTKTRPTYADWKKLKKFD